MQVKRKRQVDKHKLHFLDFYREQIEDYRTIGIRPGVIYKLLQSQLPSGVEVSKDVFIRYCRRRVKK